ncbi:MAG: hypothetical protein ACR2G4_13400 [Pyrinomonadaceae bacterium]
MSSPEPKQSPGRTLTPLWVISLFVSLTEAVLGAAVTQTSGNIQVALTAFVVVFPLLIAIGFFAILWFRPHHFYSPTEFGQQGAREFVEAITQRKPLDENQLFTNIQKTIRATLASNEIVSALTETVGNKQGTIKSDDAVRILESAADKAVENIREENFLTINTRPLLGNGGKIWRVPYDQFRTISDLLDDTWITLNARKKIPPFTYGEKWILKDAKSNRLFKDVGMLWAEKRGMARDSRKLEDVGILPGMELEAVFIEENKQYS